MILISYTWEDDANKLIADDETALSCGCADELDTLLYRCTNIHHHIKPYLDLSAPRVIHWSRQPSYRGCAKLYRERSYQENYALLTYNQQYSARSGLYLAGEAYSVEGGWTEPALRHALDAVVHVLRNTGGEFRNGFDFARYPRYDVSWRPGEDPDASPGRAPDLTPA